MKLRRIQTCSRCYRVLFVDVHGHCESCRKQLIAFGAPFAPVKPGRRKIPSAKILSVR